MAYSVKYRFDFDSDQGSAFRIDILKEGAHGSIRYRAVGGSPVIRREKSDCICGTSLEFPADCAVDNEFEEFKTSVPFTFQVKVYGGTSYGTLIWTGYITPELMEAPDIAPPYDVQVCATDGLGELKYVDFPARGGNTLWNHLNYLLSQTGLNLSVSLVNDITHGDVAVGRFLHETGVNLDFLAGKSCYDVLQTILTSIHATITQQDGKWLIFRETGADVQSSSIANAYVDGSTTADPIPVPEYGSASDHARWPVGHMTHGNVPPRKGMSLTADNHYVPNILSDALWQAVSGGTDEGDYWSLPAAGDGMKNYGVSFIQPITQKLILSVKVRNVGNGSDAGKLSVKVKAVGTSYSGSSTYYLSNGTYGRRNPTTDFTWASTEQDSVIDVQAPATTDDDDDYVEIGILLPIYRNSERDYFYCSSLEVTISNADGTYPQRIYGVALYKYDQFSGFKKEISLDNGARGRGSDLSLAFSPIVGGNNYTGTQELQYGVLFDPTDATLISTLKSSKFTTAMDYLSLMARDYALSIAGARTYVRGVLNVPVGTARIPVAFKDGGDGKVCFIDTLSWDLFNDEMSVEMTSVPATSITVDDEVDETAATQNATGHQQAQSSGGGGGGGTGTVTSVGLSIDTYFDITGSPVTGAGTLQAALKSTYKIPSTTEWSAVDNVKHSHSNKSVLDDIDSTKVGQWDAAYTTRHTHGNKSLLDAIDSTIVGQWNAAYDYAHSHNNKTVLDGITAAKVQAWDAGLSGDTVNVSIGGSSTAPTVQVALGTGSSDDAALPVADTTHAGIVDTGEQAFGGAKTFTRIYLGNSKARGMYIEYDDTARAFKFVGDIYATGDIAAGS